MSASAYVGRIGALAAAFGVGAAILTGPAIAWADTAGSDTSGSPTGSQAPADTGSRTPASRGHGARSGARTPESSSTSSQSSSDASAPNLADAVQRALTPRRTSDSAEAAPQPSADPSPSPAAAKANNDAPAAAPSAADSAPVAPVASPAPAASVAPVEAVTTPAPAATQTVTSFVETVKTAVAPKLTVTSNAVTPSVTFPTALAGVANHISTVINSVVTRLVDTFSGHSPFAPQVDSPANWLLLAFARRQPAAAATTAVQANAAANPTLFVLNGYNVVPVSPKLVTSLYGPFTNFPGYPGVQSAQQFNLVDPKTKAVVGSFNALQTMFKAIGTSRTLVVTEVLSGTAGTEAGKVPPVGSVISSTNSNGFGNLYTAMPTPSGDQLSFKLVNPLGSIPLPVFYDAAKGLTDYVEVNKRLTLADGSYIAPAVPSTEKMTGISALPPLFSAVQGSQSYALYDKANNLVGGFEGLVTATSDTLGLFTKLILVTSTGDSTNVGTGAGQVPPVGTVYNIINFTDKVYMLYSSMPSSSGDVYSTKLVLPGRTIDLPIPFNASKPPELKSIKSPFGYKFVPASPQVTAGVNALPPRDMITQGYQQFDVFDASGKKIGNVDADITRQWDWLGGGTDTILITKVNSGNPGLLAWNVPPVGSVFGTKHLLGIDTGFSDFYSSIPTAAGDVVTYANVTPFGPSLNFLPNYLSAELRDAAYVNPFV